MAQISMVGTSPAQASTTSGSPPLLQGDVARPDRVHKAGLNIERESGVDWKLDDPSQGFLSCARIAI